MTTSGIHRRAFLSSFCSNASIFLDFCFMLSLLKFLQGKNKHEGSIVSKANKNRRIRAKNVVTTLLMIEDISFVCLLILFHYFIRFPPPSFPYHAPSLLPNRPIYPPIYRLPSLPSGTQVHIYHQGQPKPSSSLCEVNSWVGCTGDT